MKLIENSIKRVIRFKHSRHLGKSILIHQIYNIRMILGLTLFLILISGCVTGSDGYAISWIEDLPESIERGQIFEVVVCVQNNHSAYNNDHSVYYDIFVEEIVLSFDPSALKKLSNDDEGEYVLYGKTKCFVQDFMSMNTFGEFNITANVEYKDPISDKILSMNPRKKIIVEDSGLLNSCDSENPYVSPTCEEKPCYYDENINAFIPYFSVEVTFIPNADERAMQQKLDEALNIIQRYETTIQSKDYFYLAGMNLDTNEFELTQNDVNFQDNENILHRIERGFVRCLDLNQDTMLLQNNCSKFVSEKLRCVQ